MNPPGIEPDLRPWLPLIPELDLGSIQDVHEARTLIRTLRERRAPPVLPTDVVVDRHTVPGPPAGPGVPVVVCSPVARRERRPLLLYMHGGGFVLGDVESDLTLPAQISAAAEAVVVSVDYRLAPEHPYPAAIEDCLAALHWAADDTDLGLDLTRVAVGGVSAGAGLAAALTLLVRDRGGPAICFQLLDIPMLDDRLDTPSMLACTDTPMWSCVNAADAWRHYLGPDIAGWVEVSEYAAPARAADLSGLPPAYVSVCTHDPLRDEGIDFAQRLVQAGVPTELHLFPGTFHGSSGAVPSAASSVRMRTELLAAASRALGSSVDE